MNVAWLTVESRRKARKRRKFMKLIKLASAALMFCGLACDALCFCLGKKKRACLFSGQPEFDPRQEPKEDICLLKHHHRQNITHSQIFAVCVCFGCFRGAHQIHPALDSCHLFLTRPVSWEKGMSSRLFYRSLSATKTSFHYSQSPSLVGKSFIIRSGKKRGWFDSVKHYDKHVSWSKICELRL